MLSRSSIGAIARTAAFLAALLTTVGGAWAFDDAQYPNLKGQWIRARPPAGVTGQGPFDPDKSWGRAQQAPLTPEYQARLRRASPIRPPAAKAVGRAGAVSRSGCRG
jgi:hypothetical protein